MYFDNFICNGSCYVIRVYNSLTATSRLAVDTTFLRSVDGPHRHFLGYNVSSKKWKSNEMVQLSNHVRPRFAQPLTHWYSHQGNGTVVTLYEAA